MRLTADHRMTLRCGAFTIVEVIVALALAGILLSGLIVGYTQVLRRAEWSAYSLAANSLASQRLEQTRAAKWDTLAAPLVDQLVGTNFPPAIEVLDVPISGTNATLATNFTTIQTVSVVPPLKLVQVDCVWSFHSRGVFTNTIITYRAPDQ
jgi:prepilin-type N-terminal cleavage/methylation domain-containing protein